MKLYDILHEGNWLKNVVAADKYNEICPSTSPDACRFCLLGAIWNLGSKQETLLVGGKSIIEIVAETIKETFPVIGELFPSAFNQAVIALFNDRRCTTEEDVIKVIHAVDAKIASLQSQHDC